MKNKLCKQQNSAGFFKRLFAMFYDAMALLVLVFFASFLLLPFESMQFGQPFFALQYVYISAIIFLYFGWSWKRGGQTLGLKSWKLQLVSLTDHPVTWKQIMLRLLSSGLCWLTGGLGFLWIFFSKDRLAWNDSLSHTRIIVKSDN